MRISMIRSLFLAVVVAACTSPGETVAPVSAEPLTSVPPPAHLRDLDKAHEDKSATITAIGLGSVDLTAANGGFADFAFLAHRTKNDKAFGYFWQRRTRNDLLVEFEGRVICLTTDPAFPGRARIGGIVTANRSTDPAFLTENHVVGAHVWFRVTDGARGMDAVDASTTYGFKPTLVNTSEEYCALPFTGLPAWNPASIFPLERGWIRVKG